MWLLRWQKKKIVILLSMKMSGAQRGVCEKKSPEMRGASDPGSKQCTRDLSDINYSKRWGGQKQECWQVSVTCEGEMSLSSN